MFSQSHSLATFLQSFPALADPWITFLFKVAGVVAIVGVPVSNIVLEWRKRVRAERIEAEEKAAREAKTVPMSAQVASPIMSAFSDQYTVDNLRTDMMTLDAHVMACTDVAGALLLAIEALAAAKDAGREPPTGA